MSYGRFASTLTLISLLLMTACVSNNTVVQNTTATANGGTSANKQPAPQPKRQINPASVPCLLPPDQRGAYASAIFVNKLTVQPPLAVQQHVAGCASAKFKLDATGHANTITVLQEAPISYGYAEALSQEIQGSTFKPPVDINQWYYIMMTETFR